MNRWTSWAEFIHMGGYGLYVWGAYGITLALMLLEPVMATHRRRRALADVHQGDAT